MSIEIDQACRSSAVWWKARAEQARAAGDESAAQLADAMCAWWLKEASAWIAGASLPDALPATVVSQSAWRDLAIRFLNMLFDPESYGHSVTPEIRSVAREIASVECSAYG